MCKLRLNKGNSNSFTKSEVKIKNQPPNINNRGRRRTSDTQPIGHKCNPLLIKPESHGGGLFGIDLDYSIGENAQNVLAYSAE